MATYSTNQNRHLYVATGYNATVSEASAVGTIGNVKCVKGTQGDEITFSYKGADGVLKSDRIQIKNFDYGKAVAAADMVTPLKSVKVTLDNNINEGAPVSGQDYILRINLRQFYGMSDQDQYFKDACVHATASMTAAQFYQKMVDSLNLCFSREVGATKTSNPYFTFSVDSGIVITEKEQDWNLGTRALESVLFDVVPTTIYTGGDDVQWGVVTDVTPAKADYVVGTNAVGNGKKIADLEYFCMGERGDQYRMIGYPNYIPTKYLVDPTKEYNALEIHHAFTDSGVNSYRSEKDITIVAESASVLNSLIDAINDVQSSVAIEKLTVAAETTNETTTP